MSRIRSVHPGLFTDDAFAQLSDAAQVFWIGLWTEADDQGIFEWKPITLKMRLRPASTQPVEPLLDELVALNCITSYELKGRKYGAIRNFRRHQRPKKPNSIYPITPEIGIYTALTDDSSEPEALDTPLSSPPVPNQFPTASEFAPQMEDEGRRKKEEKKESKITPVHPPTDAQRGSRLADGWMPTAADCDFAEGLGLQWHTVLDEFRDYWRSVPGLKGRKVDWSATFRNRCREKAERSRPAAKTYRNGFLSIIEREQNQRNEVETNPFFTAVSTHGR